MNPISRILSYIPYPILYPIFYPNILSSPPRACNVTTTTLTTTRFHSCKSIHRFIVHQTTTSTPNLDPHHQTPRAEAAMVNHNPNTINAPFPRTLTTTNANRRTTTTARSMGPPPPQGRSINERFDRMVYTSPLPRVFPLVPGKEEGRRAH
jgi:hypothetical protein